MNPKPFHPVGLPDTHGGIKVAEGQVLLIDPITEEIEAKAPLPAGANPADLYTQQRLFELFPGQTWYTGLPWQGQVKLTLVLVDREREIEGTVEFQRDGEEPDGPYIWTAAARYGLSGPQWEIDVPLPADHPYYSDVAFRFELARAIYRFIGERFPAVGLPGDTLATRVCNVFSGPDLFKPQPFLLYRFPENLPRYLETTYGWAWH